MKHTMSTRHIELDFQIYFESTFTHIYLLERHSNYMIMLTVVLFQRTELQYNEKCGGVGIKRM